MTVHDLQHSSKGATASMGTCIISIEEKEQNWFAKTFSQIQFPFRWAQLLLLYTIYVIQFEWLRRRFWNHETSREICQCRTSWPVVMVSGVAMPSPIQVASSSSSMMMIMAWTVVVVIGMQGTCALKTSSYHHKVPRVRVRLVVRPSRHHRMWL